MPKFKLAYRITPGHIHKEWRDTLLQGRTSHRPDALRYVVLAQTPPSASPTPKVDRPFPPLVSAQATEQALQALGWKTSVSVFLDSTQLTLDYWAAPGVLHYFRLADATLIPLPPEHEPTRHKLAPGHRHESPLRFAAGDAYIAVSPGAGRITDSPAVARFIHLRDYFNAEKMAEALLAHLLEVAGADTIPEDVTVLVVEAR